MSTEAKDRMIDWYRLEEMRDEIDRQEYEPWLDWLDQQPEQQARLMEPRPVPSPTGGDHAEILNRG